ncbi:MAG: VIT1/CCC1 transporter family protein [Streptosporangiaceae bacterium]
MDDDFDYLPGEQRPPAGTRVPSYPYGGPPRTGQTGPQPRINGTGAQPRLTAPVHGPYAPVNGAYPQANGTHTRTNGNGRPAPRYLPPNGYPTMSGPGIPGYPLNGQATAGRPATLQPTAPGYPPASGRGYPAGGPSRPGYPAPNGQAYPGYPATDERDYPDYPATEDQDYRRYYEADGYRGYSEEDGYPGYSEEEGPDDPEPAGKRILGRLVLLPKALPLPGQALREHRDVSGGWLRPAVFGAMDGLVTNSSLIAGVGGGGGARAAIVLTGMAGLIAGAFSMATGEYISVTSQNELTAAEVELERLQHRRDRAAKVGRLTEIYMDKGVSPNLAEAVARQISADEDRAVATHVREELGIDPDDMPSPRTAAVASFAAFTVGALLPLSPFLLGVPNLKLALIVAGIAAIAGGAAVAKLTDRSMLLGGLRQFTAAFLATGMAFLVGHLIGGHIS